jgi:hypothetical protein
MGDFDFLSDAKPSRRRVVVRHQRPSSGCLPIVQVAFGVVLGVILLFGGCAVLVGIGTRQAIENVRNGSLMNEIHDQVLTDAIKQYDTVVRGGGSEIDKAVHAQMVMEACAQAKDDAGYAKWKAIYDGHAKRGGLPAIP